MRYKCKNKTNLDLRNIVGYKIVIIFIDILTPEK